MKTEKVHEVDNPHWSEAGYDNLDGLLFDNTTFFADMYVVLRSDDPKDEHDLLVRMEGIRNDLFKKFGSPALPIDPAVALGYPDQSLECSDDGDREECLKHWGALFAGTHNHATIICTAGDAQDACWLPPGVKTPAVASVFAVHYGNLEHGWGCLLWDKVAQELPGDCEMYVWAGQGQINETHNDTKWICVSYKNGKPTLAMPMTPGPDSPYMGRYGDMWPPMSAPKKQYVWYPTRFWYPTTLFKTYCVPERYVETLSERDKAIIVGELIRWTEAYAKKPGGLLCSFWLGVFGNDEYINISPLIMGVATSDLPVMSAPTSEATAMLEEDANIRWNLDFCGSHDYTFAPPVPVRFEEFEEIGFDFFSCAEYNGEFDEYRFVPDPWKPLKAYLDMSKPWVREAVAEYVQGQIAGTICAPEIYTTDIYRTDEDDSDEEE